MPQLPNNYANAVNAAGGNFGQPTLYVGNPNSEVWDSTDRRRTICDICKVPLNELTTPGGDTIWLHTQSWRDYDHDPQPTTIIEANDFTHSACDFCGVTARMWWIFTGTQIQLGSGNTLHDYGSRWAACEYCGPLIQNGDIPGLLEHALRVGPAAREMSKAELQSSMRGWVELWQSYIPSIHSVEYVGPKREPARLNARLMPKLQQGLVKYWSHINLVTTMDRHRAERGQNFSFPGLHCGDEDTFVVRFEPQQPITESIYRNHTQHLAAGIGGSDLYWISSDFTQLAIQAGKDFDRLVISREELPSPFGFMIFEEPIGDISRPSGQAAVRGVTWTLVPGGIWLNLYIQGEDADPFVDVDQMRRDMGWLLCPNVGSGIEFNIDINVPEDRTGFEYITTIFATWFLMTQPGVAEANPAPVDKKLARSYQREHGRKLPDVKLFDLRRQPHRAAAEPSEGREGRKYTFRVYRKGHWKRQAYGPARSLRKTIYVSGYIAGPEGTPLKDRPTTVKVLR